MSVVTCTRENTHVWEGDTWSEWRVRGDRAWCWGGQKRLQRVGESSSKTRKMRELGLQIPGTGAMTQSISKSEEHRPPLPPEWPSQNTAPPMSLLKKRKTKTNQPTSQQNTLPILPQFSKNFCAGKIHPPKGLQTPFKDKFPVSPCMSNFLFAESVDRGVAAVTSVTLLNEQHVFFISTASPSASQIAPTGSCPVIHARRLIDLQEPQRPQGW